MSVTQIVDLTADVVPFLRLQASPPSDMQDTINAATSVIEDMVGHVVSATFADVYDGGDTEIYLRETPVLSIQSIVETIGLVDYTLTLQPVGSPVDNFGYTLDDTFSGKIVRRSAGSQPFEFYDNVGNIAVAYTAGTASVAWNVKRATLLLIRHMFSFDEQSFGPQSAYVPSVQADDSHELEETPSGFLVPRDVWELCQVNPRPAVFA